MSDRLTEIKARGQQRGWVCGCGAQQWILYDDGSIYCPECKCISTVIKAIKIQDSKYDDECKRLRGQLSEAIEDIESWAGYASQYFQDKHDLQGCLARHRAALEDKPAHTTACLIKQSGGWPCTCRAALAAAPSASSARQQPSDVMDCGCVGGHEPDCRERFDSSTEDDDPLAPISGQERQNELDDLVPHAEDPTP